MNPSKRTLPDLPAPDESAHLYIEHQFILVRILYRLFPFGLLLAGIGLIRALMGVL